MQGALGPTGAAWTQAYRDRLGFSLAGQSETPESGLRSGRHPGPGPPSARHTVTGLAHGGPGHTEVACLV